MHLTLVPPSADPFDFTSRPFNLNVPIPQSALDAHAADAPTPGTPWCLRDLRYVLTNWEEMGDDVASDGEEARVIAFEDFRANREHHGAEPLVTPHYATSKVQAVFAAWQASKPGRERFRLEVKAVRHLAIGWRTGVSVGMVCKPQPSSLADAERSGDHGR